jgi:hypothetical protein
MRQRGRADSLGKMVDICAERNPLAPGSVLGSIATAVRDSETYANEESWHRRKYSRGEEERYHLGRASRISPEDVVNLG